jgi:putative SOS response-associated peptidase YedK
VLFVGMARLERFALLFWEMCGRYTLTTTKQDIYRYFGVADRWDFPARYNVAPTAVMPVIRPSEGDAGLEVEVMRWGLVPSWAKAPGAGMINARSETVHQKPAFRTAFRKRRCLVPSNGFFEWKGAGTSKQPYFIGLPDRRLFAFAGIWDAWKTAEGQLIHSFAILTTAASEVIAPVHDRMPVILRQKDHPLWLDLSVQNPDAFQAVYAPLFEEAIVIYPVSKRVGSPRNDTPDCVEPLSPLPQGLF